jgi:hypothetical protein
VTWYLAAARRVAEEAKPSLAVLLLYAAMERYMGLCLWARYGLKEKEPDYSMVKPLLDWGEFDEAGKRLFGKRYRRRSLEGPLMFANSAQLLATLAPHDLGLEDLPGVGKLSAARNRCEYEHGFLPMPAAKRDYDESFSTVGKIVEKCLGQARLDEILADYKFPRFRQGQTNQTC